MQNPSSKERKDPAPHNTPSSSVSSNRIESLGSRSAVVATWEQAASSASIEPETHRECVLEPLPFEAESMAPSAPNTLRGSYIRFEHDGRSPIVELDEECEGCQSLRATVETLQRELA